MNFTRGLNTVNFRKSWIVVGVTLRGACSAALLAIVEIYRLVGGSHFGGACRFEPSCSAYAAAALRERSPGEAVNLIFRRVVKCRPGGPWGFDPLPKLVKEAFK